MSSDDDFELTFSDQSRLTRSELTARKELLKRELEHRGEDPRLADHADVSQSKIRLKELKVKMEKSKEHDARAAKDESIKQRQHPGQIDAQMKPTTESVMTQSNEQQKIEEQAMQDEVQPDQTG